MIVRTLALLVAAGLTMAGCGGNASPKYLTTTQTCDTGLSQLQPSMYQESGERSGPGLVYSDKTHQHPVAQWDSFIVQGSGLLTVRTAISSNLSGKAWSTLKKQADGMCEYILYQPLEPPNGSISEEVGGVGKNNVWTVRLTSP